MRFTVVVALALALAAPARADRESSWPRLALAGPSLGMAQPDPGLVSRLSIDTLLMGSAEGGSGGGQRPEPVLALVLGIIPGFGLGHFYAGAKKEATTWLIIDLALLGGSIVIWVLADNPVDALVWIAWIVERGFEGYFAFKAAGGSSSAAAPAPGSGVLASLDPRATPATRSLDAPDARAAPAFALRF
ncbi:MAG TPA: hypothetical protein VFR85_12860 [Anaeromyxobacteraceae bacterium]|nr:hypothetical protein [Anaeromyxobacteraceae bacterium]